MTVFLEGLVNQRLAGVFAVDSGGGAVGAAIQGRTGGCGPACGQAAPTDAGDDRGHEDEDDDDDDGAHQDDGKDGPGVALLLKLRLLR